jgi:hypothetical protein
MATTLIHVMPYGEKYDSLNEFYRFHNINVAQVESLLIQSGVQTNLDGIEKCTNLKWLGVHFTKIPVVQYNLRDIKIVDLDDPVVPLPPKKTNILKKLFGFG